ncbi:hypothetical protein Gpo141_00011327 [Globisporangium polare]
MDEKNDCETSETPHLTAPVYSPLCPPRITSISHEVLVKWRRERLMRLCWTSVHARLTVSAKSTMDQSLLATCCEMKWGTSADKISDKELLTEFDKILGSVKNNKLPKIDKLFDEGLDLNLKETNVTARVMDYFRDCNELIKKNELASVFSSDARERQKSPQLVRRLEPAALREAVVEHQRFQDQKSKS